MRIFEIDDDNGKTKCFVVAAKDGKGWLRRGDADRTWTPDFKTADVFQNRDDARTAGFHFGKQYGVVQTYEDGERLYKSIKARTSTTRGSRRR